MQTTLGSNIPLCTHTHSQSELRIGSDESLKGDSFGGIVVAGVLATEAQRKELSRIGVMDSKKLSTQKITYLANCIMQIVPYAVQSIMPQEYNNTSLTLLLNTLHKQVATELAQNVSPKPVHIVDLYPGCRVGDIMETKAESKYVEVAAASILARNAALQQMDELSHKAGFTLPLGSTHVTDALIELKKRKLNPAHFVKLHFKNVQAILK